MLKRSAGDWLRRATLLGRIAQPARSEDSNKRPVGSLPPSKPPTGPAPPRRSVCAPGRCFSPVADPRETTMFKKLRLQLGSVLAVLLLGSTTASADDIAPPDQPGPFYVGVTTFSATMTGGRVTRVQVFYPTIEPPDQNF